MNDLEQPPDDAFVRTAIRGMQTPDHQPDFWDDLASRIDHAEGPVVDAGLDEALGAPREFEMPGPTPRGRRVHARPAHRAVDHGARRAPLRAVPVVPHLAPIPEPISAPAPAAAATRSVLARADAAAVGRTAAFVSRAADPLAKLKVEHDAATLPFSMRRTSNMVLLTVALMAVIVAMFAGLSLVRQRSDIGAPAPLELPADPADAVQEELAA